jgi:hypothetical protein
MSQPAMGCVSLDEVELKATYDPDNLFRVNRNIPQRALRAVDEQLGARSFLATDGRWYGQARPDRLARTSPRGSNAVYGHTSQRVERSAHEHTGI